MLESRSRSVCASSYRGCHPVRLRSSAGVTADLRRISLADERRIDLDRRIDAGSPRQLRDDLAHRNRVAGRDVGDDRSRLSAVEQLEQEAVGDDDVADIAEVAPDVDVARRGSSSARPAWTSSTRRAKAGAANIGRWPGPVWLNARVTAVGMPCRTAPSTATVSCATFERPYGAVARSGASSVSGRSAGSGGPYTSDEPVTSSAIRESTLARASTSAWVPPAFVWIARSGSAVASGPNETAARCATASGRRVQDVARGSRRRSRDPRRRPAGRGSRRVPADSSSRTSQRAGEPGGAGDEDPHRDPGLVMLGRRIAGAAPRAGRRRRRPSSR